MKLTPEVLHRFLTAGVESAPENLTADRFPLKLRAEMALMKADRQLEQRVVCAVLDISQSGVAIGCDIAVAAGAAFVLWMKDAEQQSNAIECQAVQARPNAENKSSMVAARYIRMRPDMAAGMEDPAISAIRAAILG